MYKHATRDTFFLLVDEDLGINTRNQDIPPPSSLLGTLKNAFQDHRDPQQGPSTPRHQHSTLTYPNASSPSQCPITCPTHYYASTSTSISNPTHLPIPRSLTTQIKYGQQYKHIDKSPPLVDHKRIIKNTANHWRFLVLLKKRR